MSSASFSITFNSRPRRYRCGPSWVLDLRLADHDFWFVHGGRATLQRKGRDILIERGQCLIFFPGETVTGYQDPDDPLDVTGIHFDISVSALVRPLGQTKIDHNADRSMIESWLGHMDLLAGAELHWQAVSEHLFSCILIKLMQKQQNEEHEYHALAIKKLAVEIRAMPHQSWTIERMCRLAGMCRTVLHESFMATAGIAPGAFVIRSRIEAAEALLLDTKLSVQEVALATGYRDIFFFSRQFKHFRGLSPAAYRRSFRPKSE